MVILDEPSSALDPLAEYNMYNNMMKLSEGKGVIFISHRLSSTKFCHKVAMFEDSHLVEFGTHDELMNLKGKYYELYETQAQLYREENKNDD